MSTDYKASKDVPTSIICNRLKQLSDAVTKGKDAINREFGMRIPAECDYDADLVLSEAAVRLNDLQLEKIRRDRKDKDIAMLLRRLHTGNITQEFFFEHIGRFIDFTGNPLRKEG